MVRQVVCKMVIVCSCSVRMEEASFLRSLIFGCQYLLSLFIFIY